MPITLTLARQSLKRLAKLTLACDQHKTSVALSHVLLHITGTTARFIATDGTMLAVLRCAIEGAPSETIRIMLDRAGVESAASQLAEVSKPATVTIDISPTEVRWSRGTTAALVKTIDAEFPRIDGVLAGYDGAAWIPTISTISGNLIARAERIAGIKQTLFWASPVPPSSTLARALQQGATVPDQTVTSADLQHGVTRPALWVDHELMVLLMPINRPAGSCNITLSEFLASPLLPAAVAA